MISILNTPLPSFYSRTLALVPLRSRRIPTLRNAVGAARSDRDVRPSIIFFNPLHPSLSPFTSLKYFLTSQCTPRYLQRHDAELAQLKALHRKGQRPKAAREDMLAVLMQKERDEYAKGFGELRILDV